MYASAPFMAALYTDVKERLPLWNTDYVALSGSTAKAVVSTWSSDDGVRSAKVFLGLEASTHAAITPEVVEAWIGHVSDVSGSAVTGDVLCFLCFIDASGVVSYYTCETASTDA